ncbi:fungal-specific transcription factor domain-containing protein [Mycena floridula]|nr:fungal-specific transcription factor domain-containing protein [Mycena floridula]
MSRKINAWNAISCHECRGRKGDAATQIPCSNCIQANAECIFIRVCQLFALQKTQRPPKSYVESLEKRIEATKVLLKQVRFTLACRAPTKLRQVMSDSGLEATSQPESEAEKDGEEDEQFDFNVPGIRFDPPAPWIGYFGKSSENFLVRAVADMKQNFTGRPTIQDKPSSIREEFWNPYPWETWPVGEHPIYHFPPNDLMMSLIDLYFRHMNLIMPLLHRPTFEKLLTRGEHLDRSSKFGTVLSLVLALGSRWSTDERVLLDDDRSLHSSGWKWYRPASLTLSSITDRYAETTTLYDLQAICLWIVFAFGSCSEPVSLWPMIGNGIRCAQSIGAVIVFSLHRKKPSSEEQHPVTSELLKRAWWALFCMDVMIGATLGRPAMILREDFDNEMPIDCDDEYWEHPDPDLAFKQPDNKPSKVSFFISCLGIAELTASALRTLYCTKGTRDLFSSLNPQWEKYNLGLLDSAINHWIEDLPDHLRWNPDEDDLDFFAQSFQLYTCLYQLQILVHRPFLPAPGNEATSSATSLAICTNAARSCSHIVDIFYRRTGQIMPFSVGNVFISGVVLMLQLWAGRRVGLNVNLIERKADVQKCLDWLSRCEVR